MELKELTISIKEGIWREKDANAKDADEEFEATRGKAIRRDKDTCQYCGLIVPRDAKGKNRGLLDVHHIDDDHNNNSIENLVTVCKFCHMCHHIGYAAKQGLIKAYIWLPTMRQEDLNIIQHCIAVALAYEKELPSNEESETVKKRTIIDFAKKMYGHLVQRGESSAFFPEVFTRKLAGAKGKPYFNVDHKALPATLSKLLKENKEYYKNRDKVLGGLKVVYDLDKFTIPAYSGLASWLAGSAWGTNWYKLCEPITKPDAVITITAADLAGDDEDDDENEDSTGESPDDLEEVGTEYEDNGDLG